MPIADPKPAKETAKKAEPAKPVEEPKPVDPDYNVISDAKDSGSKKKGWWSRMIEK